MRLSRLVPLVALVLAAAPAWAYTIFLKDGSSIQAQEKYQVQGDLALIRLQSGTTSSIPLAEIDVARTEAANQNRYDSTTMVIEGGQATGLKTDVEAPRKQTLSDLIRERSDGELRAPEAASAPRAVPDVPVAAARLAATRPSRAPYPDTGVATQLLAFVSARGISAVSVHRGRRADAPMLAFETASEGSVFKAIVAGASALVQARAAGAEISGVEVVCETPDGGTGGSFDLTPELARRVLAGEYEITRFFVENVRF